MVSTANTPLVPTPTATCVTQNVGVPPVHPAVQTTHAPYLVPLSPTPRTPHRNTFLEPISQDLGNTTPTQYIRDSPRGALTRTPVPTPRPSPLSPLEEFSPHSYFPPIVERGENDGPTGLELIPNPTPSNSFFSYSDPDHRPGTTLRPSIPSNNLSSKGTSVEWNFPDPADMARHNSTFIARAHEPATNPSTKTLRIDFRPTDQPEARWEPIIMTMSRPIQIADVLRKIRGYFQEQPTQPECDTIQSHGKRNTRTVENSWRERVDAPSQVSHGARSAIHCGSIRCVGCLGSYKNQVVGLWVQGPQLKLAWRE
jgi:hypothetical protein